MREDGLTDHRWEGYRDDELADVVDQLVTGRGSESMTAASETLDGVTDALRAIDVTLYQQLGAIGVHWQSKHASAMATGALGDSRDYSNGAMGQVMVSARSVGDAGGAYEAGKRGMPDSSALRNDPQRHLLGEVGTAITGNESDYTQAVRARDEARNQAIDGLNNYGANSRRNLAAHQPLPPAPPVSVQAPGASDGPGFPAGSGTSPAGQPPPVVSAPGGSASPTGPPGGSAPPVTGSPSPPSPTPGPTPGPAPIGGAPPVTGAVPPVGSPVPGAPVPGSPVPGSPPGAAPIGGVAPVPPAGGNAPGGGAPGGGSAGGGVPPVGKAPLGGAPGGIPPTSGGGPAGGGTSAVPGTGGGTAGPGGGAGGGAAPPSGGGKVMGVGPTAPPGAPAAAPGPGAAAPKGLPPNLLHNAALGGAAVAGGAAASTSQGDRVARGGRGGPSQLGALPDGETAASRTASRVGSSSEQRRSVLQPATGSTDEDEDATHVRRYGVEAEDLFVDQRMVVTPVLGDDRVPDGPAPGGPAPGGAASGDAAPGDGVSGGAEDGTR